jgi:RHS repeat-associated protein
MELMGTDVIHHIAQRLFQHQQPRLHSACHGRAGAKCFAHVFGALAIAVAVLTYSEPARADQGWCTSVAPGVTQCAGTPMAACKIQQNAYAPGATFYGFTDTSFWNVKDCQWSSGSGSLPATVSYVCPTGDTGRAPGYCIPTDQDFQTRGAFNQGPPPNACNADTAEFNGGGSATGRTLNSIDVLSGAKLFRIVDFTTADGALLLERFYNSFGYGGVGGLVQEPLGLGSRWHYSFQNELHIDWLFQYDGSIDAAIADGGIYNFSKNGSSTLLTANQATYGTVQKDYTLEFVGTWPSDLGTILTSSTQWKLHDPNDRVWLFQTYRNPATGTYNIAHPISVTFRGGLQWTFSYGSYNQITSITDSYGKSISFDWIIQDSSSLGNPSAIPRPAAISKATLPDGTTLHYLYEAVDSSLTTLSQPDRLVKVEHHDASDVVTDSTTYLYENASLPFAVTGIADKDGLRRWSVEYDSIGHAITSTGPNDADKVTVSYPPVSDPTVTRTVTNALSKGTVYTHHWGTGNVYLQSVTGNASANCPTSVRTYAYSSNLISSITDEEGRVTTFTREARGLPTQIVNGYGTPLARTTSYTWNSDFHVPTQLVQPGLTATYTWNSLGQLTQVTQTDTTTQTIPYSTNGQTRTWTYTYNSFGYLLTVDGPLAGTGDTVTYAYNTSGYLASITNELGQVTTVSAVNGLGQPTTVIDPNSITYTLSYDSEWRLKSVAVDPSGFNAITALEYNAVGDVTKITRPNGAFLQYTYDDARRIIKVQDNSGASVEYDRDKLGGITARRVKNSSGSILLAQAATFDELGRLLTFIGAASQTWTSAYDKTDNRVSVTDPRSKVFHWAFDSLNRLMSETDQNNGVITLTRNGKDEITNYNDPRSLNTSYVRSGFGDIIQRASPDTGTTVYVYNALGKPTQITDARGVVTNLAYDNAGRLLTKQYPAATSENITYTWDATAAGNKGVGRLTRIEDTSGSVEWTYNALGQVTQEKKTTASVVYTIGYAYDLDGNVTQITYPSGRTVTYSRDARGLVTGVTTKKDSGSPSVTLASSVVYQPFGDLASLTYGNGLTLSRTFTQDYLLNALQVQDPSTLSFILNRTHDFGDGINLTNIANNTSETVPTVAAATNSYSYPSGNNKLASIIQGSTTVRSFTYDAVGNVTADTRGSTVYNYRYNNRNRLDQLSIGATVTANYTYDGLERMAIRTTQNMSPAGTTHYLYDLLGRLLVEADNTGATLREYVWIDDLPLAVVSDVNSGSPNLYYVHGDQLNRPIKMTDGSKAVVWDAVYLPFGSVLSITGSASNNMRFPGQYFLIESGLHYNWYRHYDPTLGRYVQADPLGLVDGPSVYAYAKLGPAENVDPNGRNAAVFPLLFCLRYPELCVATVIAAVNACIVTYKVIAGKGGGGDDDKQHCEEHYRIDTDTCNGIARRRGARAGEACHASATERLAACLSGKSIPPLNTWNN